MTRRKVITLGVLAGLMGASLAGGPAQALDMKPLSQAIADTKRIVDLRARYEFVDQDPLAKDANALSLRARLGFETGKAWGTSLLIEGEGLITNEDYNNTVNGKAGLPVIADPRGWELNRFHLTNTALPQTTIVLGRQRINMDDQRFVGNVGWRQNEQTFDAVRVTNTSLANVTIDAVYLDQVNRVFGRSSPQGRRHGDTYLFNTSYTAPFGKLTGFAYLLDFEDAIAVTDSSQTYGLRFAGAQPLGDIKVGYAVSWATQSDYTTSPLNYAVDYVLADLTVAYQKFAAGVGYELLEGNGTRGFATPLATLHKFQGWADKFLATPANGIRDIYGSLTYNMGALGPLTGVSAQAIYHDYNSDRLSLDYGREWNAQVQATWKRYAFTLKFADYNAGTFATDTQKVWAQVDFKF